MLTTLSAMFSKVVLFVLFPPLPYYIDFLVLMYFIYTYYIYFSCKLPRCSSSRSGFMESLAQWEPAPESGLQSVTAVTVNRNMLNTESNRMMPWLMLSSMCCSCICENHG